MWGCRWFYENIVSCSISDFSEDFSKLFIIGKDHFLMQSQWWTIKNEVAVKAFANMKDHTKGQSARKRGY
jgi:hypothetical protein